MMNVYFEASGNLITAANDGKVDIRCESDKTDIRDTENLDDFISRHGGLEATAEYLKECYRAKPWGLS